MVRQTATYCAQAASAWGDTMTEIETLIERNKELDAALLEWAQARELLIKLADAIVAEDTARRAAEARWEEERLALVANIDGEQRAMEAAEARAKKLEKALTELMEEVAPSDFDEACLLCGTRGDLYCCHEVSMARDALLPDRATLSRPAPPSAGEVGKEES